jgi:hypothetical protein
VTVFTTTSQYHDNGSGGYVDQNDYGPHNIVAGYKITRIEARGVINFNAQTGIGTGSSIEQLNSVGIQYGATDYEVAAIGAEAGLDSGHWLSVRRLQANDLLMQWFPTTDSLGFFAGNLVDLVVTPQLLVPAGGYDIYLSVGPTSTLSVPFFTYASLRIWYAGGSL